MSKKRAKKPFRLRVLGILLPAGCSNLIAGFGTIFACAVIGWIINPNAVAETRATQTARAVARATRVTEVSPTRRVTATDRPIFATATVSAIEDTSLSKVEFAWLDVQGVVSVVADEVAGGVYGEVRVSSGFLNEDTAAALRDEAARVLGVDGLDDFGVILDDGTQAIDFVWNRRNQSFTQTRLSATAIRTQTYTPVPTNTSAPTDTPVATNTRQASSTPSRTNTPTTASTTGETYTVLNFANVRSCANTSCEIVVGLAGGTQVTVTGSEDGASVSGSTRWYSVRLKDGRTGYMHSSLVGEGVIAVAATVAPAGGGGGNSSVAAPNTSVPPAGPTSFVCPRNCDGAVAMGLSPQQAATCPGLDRDNDGVACYGD